MPVINTALSKCSVVLPVPTLPTMVSLWCGELGILWLCVDLGSHLPSLSIRVFAIALRLRSARMTAHVTKKSNNGHYGALQRDAKGERAEERGNQAGNQKAHSGRRPSNTGRHRTLQRRKKPRWSIKGHYRQLLSARDDTSDVMSTWKTTSSLSSQAALLLAGSCQPLNLMPRAASTCSPL
jgi:hypothetical protein